MGDGFQIVEIVFLAMLAGFIALRLVNVLGRRTGNEPEPGLGADPFKAPEPSEAPRSPRADLPPRPARDIQLPAGASESVRPGLQAIAAADPSFEPTAFVRGAKAAYGMVLEAFWAGDEAALRPLVSDDVLALFGRAIAQRKADGLTLENRLGDIHGVAITAAQLEGALAEVTVRFDAKLTAVTRDANGAIVQGAADQVVETHDVWTFSRHVKSDQPNWLLIATDDDA
jgi:predicted lipid-binding transport protein (Tim44 family)